MKKRRTVNCVRSSHPTIAMDTVQRHVSHTFQRFFDSGKSSGILLLICTAVSLLVANSSIGASYMSLWRTDIGGLKRFEDGPLLASLPAGAIGLLWLKLLSKPEVTDTPP